MRNGHGLALTDSRVQTPEPADEFERLLAQLEPRQARFVREYLVDANLTRAAIRAGYSRFGAHVQGIRLLRNATVARAIAAGQNRLAQKLDIRAERVLQEVARLAFSDIGNICDWGPDGVVLHDSSELSPDETAALAEIHVAAAHGARGQVRSITVRMHDKIRALHLLGRHLGLFNGPGVVTKAQVEALLEAVHGVLSDFVPAERREDAIREIGRRTDIALERRSPSCLGRV